MRTLNELREVLGPEYVAETIAEVISDDIATVVAMYEAGHKARLTPEQIGNLMLSSIGAAHDSLDADAQEAIDDGELDRAA